MKSITTMHSVMTPNILSRFRLKIKMNVRKRKKQDMARRMGKIVRIRLSKYFSSSLLTRL